MEKNKKQVYLCVDLTVKTQGRSLRTGYGRKGMLTMTEEGEQFVFDESVAAICERNPIVWEGSRLNVHKTKDGRYMVHLKRTELTAGLDPLVFSDEVFVELERAKRSLELKVES